jgi:hypothetical protein
VRVHHIAELAAESLEGFLQVLVLEGNNLAAGIADEVVVMVAARVGKLVAGDASPDVELLDELHAREDIEDSVDARDSGVPTAGAKLVKDLLGREAAILVGQELDDCCPSTPGPVAGAPQLGNCVLGPLCSGRRGHLKR